MRSSLLRSASAATQRKPLIHFLGKRTTLSTNPHSPLEFKPGIRCFHATPSTCTSLHKHKKRTSKHMNLESILDERRNEPAPHLADDGMGYDNPNTVGKRSPKFKPRSSGVGNNGKSSRMQPRRRRAFSYADAVSPEFDAGVDNGEFDSLPPVMIRDDSVSSLPSPLYALGRGDLELLQQSTSPTTNDVSNPTKPNPKKRVKWEPRDTSTSIITPTLPLTALQLQTPLWSPHAPSIPPPPPGRFRHIYHPSPKTLAKRKRWRLRTRANSKRRAKRKRTPKIYRRHRPHAASPPDIREAFARIFAKYETGSQEQAIGQRSGYGGSGSSSGGSVASGSGQDGKGAAGQGGGAKSAGATSSVTYSQFWEAPEKLWRSVPLEAEEMEKVMMGGAS